MPKGKITSIRLRSSEAVILRSNWQIWEQGLQAPLVGSQEACIAKTIYVEYAMPRLPNTSPQTLSVLELLLESPRSWHYGYALSQLTGLKSGTLYPILMRLADQGWLETRWAEPEQPGRPPRHTYRLTGEGAKMARTKLAEAAPSRMTRRLVPVPGSR